MFRLKIDHCVQVDQIFLNPQYDDTDIDYDFTLIKVSFLAWAHRDHL